jgi:hypothetical protein
LLACLLSMANSFSSEASLRTSILHPSSVDEFKSKSESCQPLIIKGVMNSWHAFQFLFGSEKETSQQSISIDRFKSFLSSLKKSPTKR